MTYKMNLMRDRKGNRRRYHLKERLIEGKIDNEWSQNYSEK